MGLLDRLRATRRPTQADSPSLMRVTAVLYGGSEDLEVVGEASYQDTLWRLCNRSEGERVRHDVTAILVPDPANPYDSNAISVQIDGCLVGYLARDVAAQYLPGLKALMASCGGYVALPGVIVGGGSRQGRLGVWLEHDPADFGVGQSLTGRRAGSGQDATTGEMRTGFSEAWLTDAEDDSYDLSWFNDLPDANIPAIAMLRELLATDTDPIDRHFQFAELEARLYRSRDLVTSALEEFDEVCQAHDAEMTTICAAFMTKWGKVPLLETYPQMAIRRQKQKDWEGCRWWAQRGLDLYGHNAAREEAVEDLLKRRNRAVAKLEGQASTTQNARRTSVSTDVTAVPQALAPSDGYVAGKTEVLKCTRCGLPFERLIVRGRKPLLCPACRAADA
jgi:hypothetical protein